MSVFKILRSSFHTGRICARHMRLFSSTTTTEPGDHDTSIPNDIHDIIITGGGMVGAAMAAALGNSPLMEDKSILLLEGGPERPQMIEPPDIHANRTCALSQATKQLLQSFGAWENIENMRLQEVKRMQVWDSTSDSMITFNHKNLSDDLAYIVENDIIQDAIFRQLSKIQDRVTIKYNSKVQSYQLPFMSAKNMQSSLGEQFAQTKLSSGETLYSRLLIGADGFKSLLRESAGIHTIKWEYDQLAVVATLEVAEEEENNVAWQRFLKTGPIALLPLNSKRSCLIWSTSTKNGRHLLEMPHDSFVDAINHAFWTDDTKDIVADSLSRTFDGLLTSVGLEGSSSQQLPPAVVGAELSTRAAFPLGLCHSTQYVGSRMALIGDAAHRVHPLAGQGVNLGFGDVTCLTEQLNKAVMNGNDIGALDHLLEYETMRQRHIVPIIAAIDGINKLYSTTFLPFVLARTLGLQAANALSPLKSMFMEQAAN